MDIIIGGAYQGKLDYAVKTYGLSEEDIFTCSEKDGLDLTKKCINEFQEYVLYCVKNGIDPKEEISGLDLEGRIIICREIFSGVVPLDETVRFWREETGRVFTRLSQRADTVTRLFCGIPERLK